MKKYMNRKSEIKLLGVGVNIATIGKNGKVYI